MRRCSKRSRRRAVSWLPPSTAGAPSPWTRRRGARWLCRLLDDLSGLFHDLGRSRVDFRNDFLDLCPVGRIVDVAMLLLGLGEKRWILDGRHEGRAQRLQALRRDVLRYDVRPVDVVDRKD